MATANTHSDDSSALSDLLKALGDLTVDKYSDRFRMLQTTYRFTGDEALRVDVLVPYELESRQCAVPVLVRIHGGFLVSSVHPAGGGKTPITVWRLTCSRICTDYWL